MKKPITDVARFMQIVLGVGLSQVTASMTEIFFSRRPEVANYDTTWAADASRFILTLLGICSIDDTQTLAPKIPDVAKGINNFQVRFPFI